MNVVITAGGTSEKIDEVRKITNRSSGKLAKIIAETLLSSNLTINKIYYICTKHTLKPTNSKLEFIEVESAQDVLKAVTNILTNNKIDVFVHSMAISDYTVDYVTNINYLTNYINGKATNLQTFDNSKKISSTEEDLIIKLKRTPKIISHIKQLSKKTYLIGFKLLSNVTEIELEEVAYTLLLKNNCNLVVANDITTINETQHIATIIDRQKNKINATTKEDIAIKLVTKLEKEFL